MSVLLITHDFKAEGKDYSSFYEALKNNCSHWWHYLKDTWIVETTKTPNEYTDLLLAHMAKEDRLLVVRITEYQQGWLPKDAWAWLNKRTY